MKVTSYDPYLVVNQSSQPYIGNNGPAAGMTRYNTQNQQLEAFDGSSWYTVSNSVDISTSLVLKEVIVWAQKKMQEEREFEDLVKRNETIKHAKEQLDILVALTKDYNEQNISS